MNALSANDTAALLHTQVAAMNPDNFIVRPQRRFIEKYVQGGGVEDARRRASERVVDRGGAPPHRNRGPPPRKQSGSTC